MVGDGRVENGTHRASRLMSFDVHPLVPVIVGVLISLMIDEFFAASDRIVYVFASLVLVVGLLSRGVTKPGRLIRGVATSVVLGGLAVTVSPMLARLLPHFHELPGWVGYPSALLLRLFGFQADVVATRVTDGGPAVEGMYRVYHLAVSHDGLSHHASLSVEKFAPLCVGLLLIWCAIVSSLRDDWTARCRSCLVGWLIVLLYQPLRFAAVVLVAWEYEWLAGYWNPWLTLVSFVPLTLWLHRLVQYEGSAGGGVVDEANSTTTHADDSRSVGLGRAGFVGWTIVTLGVALASVGFFHHPVGEIRGDRVLIDDSHSNWEWSDIPFDTRDYSQQASYNYSCLVNFLRNYFRVDINKDDVFTEALLADYDVLILKTPTRSFDASEVDAIESFVLGGGGLFMLSDHTNLFGMSTHLRPVATRFGIDFVHDDTYELVSGKPTVFSGGFGYTHPIVAPMDYFEFETSCSIRCPIGTDVMVGFGMGSELVDYGHVNFFGDILPQADEQWGGFVQKCAVDVGRGRVAAFSDSTVFSNFSMFFDDKPTLAIRTIDWLRRSPTAFSSSVRRTVLNASLLLVLIGSGVLFVSGRLASLVGMVVVGGVCATTTLLLDQSAATAMPFPETRDDVTLPPHVEFEQSMSVARLPSMLEIGVADEAISFDAFFVNLQRLGIEPYVDNPLEIGREAAFKLLINPSHVATHEFEGHDSHDGHDHHGHDHDAIDGDEGDRTRLAELARWVEDGGRLLAMGRSGHRGGQVFDRLMNLCSVAIDYRTYEVEQCWETDDKHEHRTMKRTREQTVIPLGPYLEGDIVDLRFGEGRVIFVTNSTVFSRKAMGGAFQPPTPSTMAMFEIGYEISRALMEDRSIDDGVIAESLDRFERAETGGEPIDELGIPRP